MISVVRYNSREDYTKKFSSMCNARLIWGGNDSINNIRKFTLKERSLDIAFADRYSFCVIKASEILKSYYEELLRTLNWNDKLIDESITRFVDRKGIGKGKLIQPLRLALTGALIGPSMVNLMVLLKKDTCLRRIKNSLTSIQI